MAQSQYLHLVTEPGFDAGPKLKSQQPLYFAAIFLTMATTSLRSLSFRLPE